MNPMPGKKSMGPWIGIVIVALVLIAGALYALMDSKRSKVKEQGSAMTLPVYEAAGGGAGADATISALTAQGTSSDLSDIQQDLEATDLSSLDAGLGDVSFSL
jgi:hypothetical protein